MMPVQKIRGYGVSTALPYVALSCALLVFCFAWNRVHHDGSLFWDARVYSKAIDVWMSGGDPYPHGKKEDPFLYPPLFLWGTRLVGFLVPRGTGFPLYLAAHFAAALTIPYVLAKYYCRKVWMTPFVALILFLFQPHVYSVIAIFSGNIATLLSVLLLAAGVPGIRRGRWGWFYAAVVLASLIKPSYLAWLLVPVFSGTTEYWGGLLAAAATGSGYWLQSVFSPVLYAQFRSALLTSSYSREAGVGFYALALRIAQKALGTSSHWSVNGALLVHCLVIVPVLIGISLVGRYRTRAGVENLWLPLLLVTATLVNPRMMQYDADLAIVPAAYLWVESMAYALARRVPAGVLAVPLAALGALLSIDGHAHAAVSCFLLTSLVLTLVRIAAEPSANPAFSS